MGGQLYPKEVFACQLPVAPSLERAAWFTFGEPHLPFSDTWSDKAHSSPSSSGQQWSCDPNLSNHRSPSPNPRVRDGLDMQDRPMRNAGDLAETTLRLSPALLGATSSTHRESQPEKEASAEGNRRWQQIPGHRTSRF